MTKEAVAEFAKLEIIRLCHSACDSRTFRIELLKRLRTVIPFDYVYFSTTDPATQLVTNSVLFEEPPAWCMAVFVENEFLQEDFNKFGDMHRYHQTVGILSEATRNELPRSPRYRDMLVPLTMQDELRAIFVADGACWGTLCLHRGDAELRYAPTEAAYLAQLAPHITLGLQKSLLWDGPSIEKAPNGPGLLILNDDLEVVATTVVAEHWLSELTELERGDRHAPPVIIRSVVAALKASASGQAATNAIPKIRVRTRSGHWLVVYASWLNSPASASQIAVMFEVAQPAEIAPLIMQAYQLSKREGEVTQCVLRGWSTTEIAAQLHISPNTVQDHLKAIFEKVDVGSRGELTARIFMHQYQP